MATFGRDTYCHDSLQTGRMVTGVALVAQNAYHRLITPPGTLAGGDEEDTYGFDLHGKLGSVSTPAERASLPGRIRAELLKDERIVDVTVDVAVADDAGVVSYTITVDVQTGEGPFALQLSVDDVTVTLLGIEVA